MRDNKYEKILVASARLISQQGFKEASLQKIADKVGLHKSTFFHYFNSKEELLLRILEKSVDEVNTNLERIINISELESKEKLRRAIENHLTLLTQHFDNVNIYLNELRGLSRKNQAVYLKKRKKYEKNIRKIIEEMKKERCFAGLDTKIVTFGLLGMLNWVAKWYKKEGSLDVKELSNIYYRMLIGK